MGSLSDAQETSWSRDPPGIQIPAPIPRVPSQFPARFCCCGLVWVLPVSPASPPKLARPSCEVALCIRNKIIHAPSAQSFVLNPLCRACSRNRQTFHHHQERPPTTRGLHFDPPPCRRGQCSRERDPSTTQRAKKDSGSGRQTVSPTTPNSPTLVHLYSSIRFFFSWKTPSFLLGPESLGPDRRPFVSGRPTSNRLASPPRRPNTHEPTTSPTNQHLHHRLGNTHTRCRPSSIWG